MHIRRVEINGPSSAGWVQAEFSKVFGKKSVGVISQHVGVIRQQVGVIQRRARVTMFSEVWHGSKSWFWAQNLRMEPLQSRTMSSATLVRGAGILDVDSLFLEQDEAYVELKAERDRLLVAWPCGSDVHAKALQRKSQAGAMVPDKSEAPVPPPHVAATPEQGCKRQLFTSPQTINSSQTLPDTVPEATPEALKGHDRQPQKLWELILTYQEKKGAVEEPEKHEVAPREEVSTVEPKQQQDPAQVPPAEPPLEVLPDRQPDTPPESVEKLQDVDIPPTQPERQEEPEPVEGHSEEPTDPEPRPEPEEPEEPPKPLTKEAIDQRLRRVMKLKAKGQYKVPECVRLQWQNLATRDEVRAMFEKCAYKPAARISWVGVSVLGDLSAACCLRNTSSARSAGSMKRSKS